MQATTDELKDAFKRTGLRRLGWTFEKAKETPGVLTGLNAVAVATRKKMQAAGKPAPLQLDFIEGT